MTLLLTIHYIAINQLTLSLSQMMAQRPPMSLPVSMAPISSGNMSLPPSNPGFSQTSFFDQQFT